MQAQVWTWRQQELGLGLVVSQRVRNSWMGLRIVPMAHKEVVLMWRLLLLGHGGWWLVVVDSSAVEGVGRAVELDVALQNFAATVEVNGAWGDGQLAMQLGDLGGQKGWRLSLGWSG